MKYLLIPPARRNGPRESVKENTTDAELRYIAAELLAAIATLESSVAAADTTIAASTEAVADALTAAGADATRL